MRDRLIELLEKADETVMGFSIDGDVSRLADYLIANGVIVPPCKVGQTCYKVWNGEILEIKVVSIMYEPLPAYSYAVRFNSLGVLCLLADGSRNEAYSWGCIFLTKEEAEKELERRENGKS